MHYYCHNARINFFGKSHTSTYHLLTLAANQVKNRIAYKLLSSDAQHPHQPGSSVSGRLYVSNRVVIESSAWSALI